MQLFPAIEDFTAGLRGRPQPGGLDPPRRRPRHARLADAEADRGAQGQLPARERHRRRGARPLLDHGHEARPDLGVPRHRPPASTAPPASTPTAWRDEPADPLASLRALIAESRIELAARAAADGRRPLRLPRLRHGPAGRAPAGRQPRPARPARRDHAAPLGGADRRRGEGRGHRRQPGLGRLRPQPARRLRPGRRAGDGRGPRPRPHPAAGEPRPRRTVADGDAGLQHQPRALPRDGRAGEGVHPRRRHLPGRALASAGRSRSTCRPSRSTARSGAPTLSPYMFYFNFGGFQVVGASPEILVRVKDGTVTIRPIAGTRPRGADRRPTTWRSRPSSSPTPRSAPST